MEKQASTAIPSKAFQQNICRTCLRRISTREAVYIFSDAKFYKRQPLLQMFKEITHTLIEPNDLLPKNICLKCAKKVKQLVSFKRKIEEANRMLNYNFRKAEWAHFNKVSQSIPSDFGTVLDNLCENMNEIVDEEEDDTESCVKNIKPAVKKSVDLDKVKQWQTHIDNLIEGRVFNVVNANNLPRIKRVVTPSKSVSSAPVKQLNQIERPVVNHKSQAQKVTSVTPINNSVKKVSNVLSGNAFVEELKKQVKINLNKSQLQNVIEIDADNSEQNDTVIIIEEVEAGNTLNENVKNSVTLQAIEYENREDYSLEEEIARIEKECSHLLDTNLVKPNEDKPLVCHKCEKRFTSTIILQRHLLYHSLDILPKDTDNNTNQIQQLQSSSSSNNSNTNLEQTSNAEKDTQVGLNVNAPNVEKAKAAYIPTINLITKRCQYCLEEIPEDSMRRHLRCQHRYEIEKMRQSRYTCHICKKINKTAAILEAHLRVHNRIKCDHCDKSFNNKVLLKAHLHNSHGLRMTSICYICGKMITVASMAVHIRTHTMTKSIKCTVEGCRTMLKYKSSLQSHIERVHGTEMTHMCEYCGKTFAARGSLIGHVRGHTSDLPYTCEQCDRRFRTRGYLRAHHRNMHQGEKRFQCPECPQVFSYKTSIRKHCWRYHPENPLAKTPKFYPRNYVTNPVLEKIHKCSLCLRQFAYDYNLKKHQRTYHPLYFYNQKRLAQNNFTVEKSNNDHD